MQTLLLKKFRFALLLLVLAPLSAYAQRDPPVSTITLDSNLLGTPIEYSILYPVNYQRPDYADKRFPVLYLLHGLTGKHSNWIERSRLALYATRYDLFVVMVDGKNAWYRCCDCAGVRFRPLAANNQHDETPNPKAGSRCRTVAKREKAQRYIDQNDIPEESASTLSGFALGPSLKGIPEEE